MHEPLDPRIEELGEASRRCGVQSSLNPRAWVAGIRLRALPLPRTASAGNSVRAAGVGANRVRRAALDAGLRLDILVGGCLVVELKAVEQLTPLFEAQTLTYLKLSSHRLGLLINFNVPLFKNGIKRVIR